MPSTIHATSSQARYKYLSGRLFQAVVLALFIYGATAATTVESEASTTSIADAASQTLDQLFSEAHSILSGVETAPSAVETPVGHAKDAQVHFEAPGTTEDEEIPNYSSVLVPEETAEPELAETLAQLINDPDDTIELVDGGECPDGYEEVDEAEELNATVPEKVVQTAVIEAIKSVLGEEAVHGKVESPAGGQADPPFVGDVPIDPIDESFLETVNEVLAEANNTDDTELLEEFLAELFDESETGEDDDGVPPPAQATLTEEEIAEKKRLLEIETREKRAEITKRHSNWEDRLQERGKDITGELLSQVLELRNHVANDVKNNAEVAKLLNGLENEASKAIKGVEAFVEKRLKAGTKIEQAIIKTWEDVLHKVEKKIEEKKADVEKEMQEYYNSYLEEEMEHVESAIKRIEKLADDAQADLGMDYAWLDDVTVSDWVRYHDLVRSAKQYGEVYRTIFNSTHVDLPTNEVVGALKEVQSTIADIAYGFEHLLANLHRKAQRIFKGEPEEDIPGLGEEDVVTPDGKAAVQQAEEEDVPVLGLGGSPAHPAAPAAAHDEL